jgi:hypothetical protein
MPQPQYVVLGRGEAYSEKFDKPPSGRGNLHRSFEQARASLLPQVRAVVAAVEHLPAQKRLDEVVVELRLDQKYLAKSYDPADLLHATGLSLRGTSMWTQAPRQRTERAGAYNARLFFVSGEETSINAVERILNTARAINAVKNDLIRIDSIKVPSSEERVQVTKDDRKKIRQGAAIEIVLYPWQGRLRSQAVERIRQLIASYQNQPQALVKEYDGGPTFIAARVTDDRVVDELGELNFLRSVRTLPPLDITREAVGMTFPAPPPVTRQLRPRGNLVMFDGGLEADHPHFVGHVTAENVTTRPPRPKLLAGC